MSSRLTLHEELCIILGSRNAYFQSPENVKMHYPAIRYGLSAKDIKRADNKVYRLTNQYSGVVITEDPDTTIPDSMAYHFEMCSFGKPYIADNLHHYPFTLYY